MNSSSILIDFGEPLLTADNVRCLGEEDQFSRLLAWVGDDTETVNHPTNMNEAKSDMVAYDGSEMTVSVNSSCDFWLEHDGQHHFVIMGPPSEEAYDDDIEHTFDEYNAYATDDVCWVPRDLDSTSEHSEEVDWEENFYDVVEANAWTLIWE
ncbi:hypothetical protein CDV36_015739 [Fusarium kuroshium]|uniref:Uncharacterized protein n=2 Tax=Fusarium solani species complex TaxID=232080 RepID=A0A3M2R8A6_9HYPO|nr:hypothetical protein CDV36_015739 [Fusarium kuroshium]RSL80105.1 hypothetical protein CEP51_006847 [Fusarium floridanum]